MKSSFLLLASTALALPALGQAPKPYVDKAEHFSVLLPSKPTVTTNDANAQGVTIHTKLYMATAGSETYFVSKTNLPGKVGPDFVKQFSASFETSMLQSARATKTSDKTVGYGGRKVRRIDFKMANGGKGAAIVVVLPNAIYSLAAGNRAGSITGPGERFLKSFQTK